MIVVETIRTLHVNSYQQSDVIKPFLTNFGYGGTGWSFDLTNMAAALRESRHFRPVLKGTTDMKPSLPVKPPFRQRLFPRQHASEYPETVVK